MSMATTSPLGWTTTSCVRASEFENVFLVSATSIFAYFSPSPFLFTACATLPNTSAGATTSGLLFAACALWVAPIVGATSTCWVLASVWWFSKHTALWKPGDEPFTSAPLTSRLSDLTPPGSYGSKPDGSRTYPPLLSACPVIRASRSRAVRAGITSPPFEFVGSGISAQREPSLGGRVNPCPVTRRGGVSPRTP